jgi:hypothetical protein
MVKFSNKSRKNNNRKNKKGTKKGGMNNLMGQMARRASTGSISDIMNSASSIIPIEVQEAHNITKVVSIIEATKKNLNDIVDDETTKKQLTKHMSEIITSSKNVGKILLQDLLNISEQFTFDAIKEKFDTNIDVIKPKIDDFKKFIKNNITNMASRETVLNNVDKSYEIIVKVLKGLWDMFEKRKDFIISMMNSKYAATLKQLANNSTNATSTSDVATMTPEEKQQEMAAITAKINKFNERLQELGSSTTTTSMVQASEPAPPAGRNSLGGKQSKKNKKSQKKNKNSRK